MTLDWTARQLSGGRNIMGLANPRYNPCPPGVIRNGSSTSAVLAVLRQRQGVWLTHQQIMYLSGRPTKQVCWALLYLGMQEMIESTPDDYRNARYKRYRCTDKGIGK